MTKSLVFYEDSTEKTSLREKIFASMENNPICLGWGPDEFNGIFYLDYQRHDKYQGRIVWSNNKPIAACRDLLWSNLENEDELVKNINQRISAGETNVENPEAYTFVYVHVWSKTTSDVEKVINELNKNTKVRVVTPEMFMELIKQNVKIR